uniref:Uncharacterized protein n=1 Tax=Rhizophora mucronata TaxID=61149 RepID=A0A2P2QQV4_RHIMU
MSDCIYIDYRYRTPNIDCPFSGCSLTIFCKDFS